MLVWIGFLLFILILLALDLGVFHRRAHVISVREALTWTVIWMMTALAFSGFVYLGYEHHWLGLGLEPDPVERSALHPEGQVNDARAALLKFLTGYVVELSLSADNVFVIAMLFSSFAIPRMYQHRVLFWGILGALAMRGAMIAIGARLVEAFSWVLPLFGVVLILTAVKMAFMGIEHGDPEKNVLVRVMRRFLPLTTRFDGEHFFVRARPDDAPPSPAAEKNGTVETAVGKVRRNGWMVTPLAPALVMVETTDLVFAVDSIPAIFAITADPFLVFTSNVFAILGLRSLYFALAGALHAFHYMKHALAVVLLTVGVKMLAHSWLQQVLGPDFNLWLLAAVLAILSIGVAVSIVEVRWGPRIHQAIAGAVRTFWNWIAPDYMISAILRAGRRSLSAKSTSPAQRLNARRAVARARRVRRLSRRWGSLFRRSGPPQLIFVAHRLLEEGEQFAAYL